MERKPNTGALFKVEDEKRKNENYPHYSGNCLVNGKTMNIGAWINTAKTSGKQYMSLKFQEPKTATEFTSTTTDSDVLADETVPF